MPTWPVSPIPNSVNDAFPEVPVLSYEPDQKGYTIRRRSGTSVRSGFTLTYGNLRLNDRNIFAHFIANEINFGALEFDWTMPVRNAMSITDITTDTVTTTYPHPYTKGQWVTISDTSASDGNYRVASTSTNTTLVLTGLSGTESTGLIRPHLPQALLVLERENVPQYQKLLGPVSDNRGLWNWTVSIIGVNA